MTNLAEEIAEAGIALARSGGTDECLELLVRLAREITDAPRAGVVGAGPLAGARAGDVPDDSAATVTDAWLQVPIVDPDHETTVLATLWIEQPRRERGESLARTLGRQAGLGLTRVLNRHALLLREKQQHALVDAGKALTSELSLEAVLLRIVELATELVGARYGALGVLDETGTELAQFITVGIDPEAHARIGQLPRGRGILGALISEPRPLRLRRLQDDPRSVGFPPHHPEMHSFLGVPIVTRRAVAGRIYLTEKLDAEEFSSYDEELVTTLASQAAIAIDNAQLYEQLQHTAEELAEASRHKSAFLANMSHELRSPLNTILGYAQLLMDEPGGLDAEQLEDLSIIRGSSEHLLALISDLLDLQRIETGRVSLVTEAEDATSVIAEVVPAMQPHLATDVELLVDVRDGLDTRLECDRVRLRQMLLNIVGNAAKFTEHGSITIALDGDEQSLQFTVRDTGTGIPSDDLERIFESFFQSRAALARTPRPREGAGLGLAITRMLAQLHGGDVAIDSVDGTGTTVTITMPRDAPAPTASPVTRTRTGDA